jgi:hypothetical protein
LLILNPNTNTGGITYIYSVPFFKCYFNIKLSNQKVVECCILFLILASSNPPFTFFFQINLAYIYILLSPLNFMENVKYNYWESKNKIDKNCTLNYRNDTQIEIISFPKLQLKMNGKSNSCYKSQHFETFKMTSKFQSMIPPYTRHMGVGWPLV